MSHIFSDKLGEVRVNKKARAAVTVMVHQRRRFQLVIQEDPIKFIPAITSFVALPKNWKVVDENGKEVKASEKFWVSMATCDPYHLLIDASEEILSG